MESKLLHHDHLRTYALVFDLGDEVTHELLEFANAHDLKGSHFTAIGAFRDAVLGYWDWETKEYERIPVREQVEVLSLVGNIALGPEGSPALHAHVVIGRRDGTALGGHLLEAHVRPTLEVVLTEEPEHLQRVVDPETGLTLIGGG